MGEAERVISHHCEEMKSRSRRRWVGTVGTPITATVTGDNVIHAARAMAAGGLIHGWTYINIDDAWQGQRGGKFNGVQPNSKFPDMQAMCDEIHRLGLKVGIYSTPWETSYAGYIGGSSDDSGGAVDEGESKLGADLLCPKRRRPMGGVGHRLLEI